MLQRYPVCIAGYGQSERMRQYRCVGYEIGFSELWRAGGMGQSYLVGISSCGRNEKLFE